MTPDQFVILAIAIASFWPVARLIRWLWRHNVSWPIAQRADEIVSTVVVRELKQRDGNGGHNLTDISDKVDGLRAEVDKVNVRLETATHVVRAGSIEAEPLAQYTQDRIHELAGIVNNVVHAFHLLWPVLKEAHPELPDLPRLTGGNREP